MMKFLARMRGASTLVAAAFAFAQPTFAAGDVVVSQVYGGGASTGATYKNDYVELFNRSAAPVNVAGWSVQYNSATSTTTAWQVQALTGTIPAGGYFLVRLGGTTATALDVPTPDVSGAISMSATNGKVALVNNTTALACGGTTACNGASIVDLVGYGTANTFETAATPALTATTAALRANNGCTDSDSNATDFTLGAPAPRNSASALNMCAPVTNQPIVASCPSGISLEVGASATLSVSASDADGRVDAVEQVVTVPPIANITLSNVVPAASAGAPLTATVNITGAVAGSYPLQLLFTNADAVEQGATCQISVTVTAPVPTPRIHDIQGRAHISPFSAQLVAKVPGIVTVKRSNGFFMEDPSPDSDPATSEGIFVFTSAAPAVNVGDAVQVGGRVSEFRPGGTAASNANLTTTQIGAPLTIAIVSSGNALPTPTLIGIGGRVPPTMVIDDDATGNVETTGSFDATTDGIDFWESLEGMRVQLVNAVAVGPTNSFGEIPIVADNGTGTSVRTTRGGVLARATDYNPERILIDDTLLLTQSPPQIMPNANVGDNVNDVIGVMDYSFGTFKLMVTQPPSIVNNNLQPETTVAQTTNQLAVASYNVENLDALDPPEKFAAIAAQIINNLKTPDIIGLTEIQDNNGPTNDGTVDASITMQTLVNAIVAAGGPVYDFRFINPAPGNLDGGEPGGNIRQGFLFNPARVQFVDRAGGDATTPVTAVNVGGTAQLSVSPGRVDPINSAFDASRKPLAGEFVFNTRSLIVIVNHFNSKGGDNALMGRYQPPALVSEAQRTAQATVLANFVQSIFAINPQANVIALGDFNDFDYSPPLAILKAAGLTDLADTLPENERYTYVFEGNSQSLDHILVSGNLMTRAAPIYDVVHVNAEFANQISDHDPEIVRLTMLAPPLDVSSRVYIEKNGIRPLPPHSNQYASRVQITNTSTTIIDGPVHVLFDLPAGVTLVNATGVTADGVPYITINQSIAPGETVIVEGVFLSPKKFNNPNTYSVRVLSGAFW